MVFQQVTEPKLSQVRCFVSLSEALLLLFPAGQRIDKSTVYDNPQQTIPENFIFPVNDGAPDIVWKTIRITTSHSLVFIDIHYIILSFIGSHSSIHPGPNGISSLSIERQKEETRQEVEHRDSFSFAFKASWLNY